MLALLILRMAAERPRVLVVEDLHWSDPTTLETLTLLIDELRATPEAAAPRLCVLLTARPEFAAPWNQAEMTTLSVPRLSRAGVESMVRSRLRGDEPPADVVDHIASRTDGVPLFVEELTHLLLDKGALAGRAGERRVGWETEIPGTLRELLGARLDALSTSARETAQLAAAIGREVRPDLLAASSEKDEGLLMRDLRELIDARLVQQRRSSAEGSYVFRHALVRDAAYESMLRPARQRIHARIAATIRESFPDIAEYQPEVVAQHLEQGGDDEVAVTYWQRAGDRALRRAAYPEARQHVERGLAAVEKVPASTLRTRAEVELLITLGTVLFSTQGFASPEVEATFARALTLCDQVEGRVPPKIFAGIIGVSITRGDRVTTERLLPYLEETVRTPRDVVEALTAYNGLGIAAFWRGAHVDAQDHFDRAMPLYLSDEFQRYLVEYGADSGIFAHAYAAWNLWLLGRPRAAEKKVAELLTIADGSRDPHARSLALAFAMLVAHGRRDDAETLARAERLMAVAGEQKLFFWTVIAMCARGAALARRGAPAEGIPEIRQGLEMAKMIGNVVGHAYYATFLIEALLATGELVEAESLIDEGLASCQTSLSRVHEPELWRLRGALLEARDDPDGAEAAYRTAATMARERGALAWELRAATNLGRMLHARGADADARTVVRDALARSVDDEADARDARALLAALS
jgi:tetratricopeptide (TPR) repeat protein